MRMMEITTDEKIKRGRRRRRVGVSILVIELRLKINGNLERLVGLVVAVAAIVVKVVVV